MVTQSASQQAGSSGPNDQIQAEASGTNDNITVSRAEFETMQAEMATMRQQMAVPVDAAPGTAPVDPSVTAAVPGPVTGPVTGPATGPVTAPVTGPVTGPVAASVYHGKAPKVDRYSGGSRGLYNKFVRQCQRAFNIEHNHTDAGRVAFGSARLDGTPANVWDAYELHHPDQNTITWIEFKSIVFQELGDASNLMQQLTDEWHHARQRYDESARAYAARLDQLAEDMGRRLTDGERTEKVFQATTHRELVAQAQRIEYNEETKRGRQSHDQDKRDNQGKIDSYRGGYRSHPYNQNRNQSTSQNRNRSDSKQRNNGNGQSNNQSGNRSNNSCPNNNNNQARQSNGNRDNNSKNSNSISREETQRRRDKDLCFVCGKPGHRANVCPDKPKN